MPPFRKSLAVSGFIPSLKPAAILYMEIDTLYIFNMFSIFVPGFHHTGQCYDTTDSFCDNGFDMDQPFSYSDLEHLYTITSLNPNTTPDKRHFGIDIIGVVKRRIKTIHFVSG